MNLAGAPLRVRLRSAIVIYTVMQAAVMCPVTAAETVLGLSDPAIAADLRWLADSCLEIWPDPAVFPWNWGESVMMYGLIQAASVTGDQRYWDYVQDYLDAHLDQTGAIDLTVLYPDVIAPANIAYEMFKRTGDPRYRPVCDRFAEWLMHESPRAPDGGWYHFPIVDWQYIDTLFMTTVFMAGYGELIGNESYIREALLQHTLISGKLYSSRDRLFWHGWDEDGLFNWWGTPLCRHNSAFWGRGNGWAVSSMCRVLETADPGWSGYALTRARLRAALDRLAALQDSTSGLWWTVVDVPYGPRNYTETSASALVVQAALYAARLGLAPPPTECLVVRGSAGVRARLEADESGRAHVAGASIGTNPMDYWGYVLTPTLPDRPWGIGAVLMMLAEMLR